VLQKVVFSVWGAGCKSGGTLGACELNIMLQIEKAASYAIKEEIKNVS